MKKRFVKTRIALAILQAINTIAPALDRAFRLDMPEPANRKERRSALRRGDRK